ncbi:MAG TPA: HAMP domain-containing sensor histidine kinase [Candidatus Saccharibacteria bacterium]|nr:HAMP domain-containing sensor histidine kinase [Candidatus Saccharibacteria bacterium]
MEAAKGNNNRGGSNQSDLSSVVVAAHELKSPLVLMRQLALDIASGKLSNEEQRRVVDQLVHVSEKGLRLTSDLTRAEAVQSVLFDMQPVNAISVCDDVADELAGLYNAHGRSLKRSRIRALPPVVANRDLLRRILVGFADNALHYSDIDGVVELHAQLLRDKKLVRLGVRDYGPALSNKNWRQLVRNLGATQPVQARPQSSGLGLYIAHQFAVSMNGRIGAVRHRDGASFYVELPISQQLTLL